MSRRRMPSTPPSSTRRASGLHASVAVATDFFPADDPPQHDPSERDTSGARKLPSPPSEEIADETTSVDLPPVEAVTNPAPPPPIPFLRVMEEVSTTRPADTIPEPLQGLVNDHTDAMVVYAAYAYAKLRLREHAERNGEYFGPGVRIGAGRRAWWRYYDTLSEVEHDVFALLYGRRWPVQLMTDRHFVLPEYGSGLVTAIVNGTRDVLKRERRAWWRHHHATLTATQHQELAREDYDEEARLDLRRALLEAEATLPPSDKTLFHMLLIERLDRSQIAQRLGIREATLRQRILVLRKRLLRHPVIRARYELIYRN